MPSNMPFVPACGLTMSETRRTVSAEKMRQALRTIPAGLVGAFMTDADAIYDALVAACADSIWIGVMKDLAGECEQVLLCARPAAKRPLLFRAFEQCESVSRWLGALYPNYGVPQERPADLPFGPPKHALPDDAWPSVTEAIHKLPSNLHRSLEILFFSWFAATPDGPPLPPPPRNLPRLNECNGGDDGDGVPPIADLEP